ncbi:hypothetical protein HPB50_021911 [Hyalomma asiaticum]|uniref:Uncharacterized protein n=1 Tax=Hyalomma asiaticum TaxID=266040 RepID=A0ACB7SYX1_HYAAI|nr:hypothetical protein HPB50_021911 [Hyalomma asiaticum]
MTIFVRFLVGHKPLPGARRSVLIVRPLFYVLYVPSCSASLTANSFHHRLSLSFTGAQSAPRVLSRKSPIDRGRHRTSLAKPAHHPRQAAAAAHKSSHILRLGRRSAGCTGSRCHHGAAGRLLLNRMLACSPRAFPSFLSLAFLRGTHTPHTTAGSLRLLPPPLLMVAVVVHVRESVVARMEKLLLLPAILTLSHPAWRCAAVRTHATATHTHCASSPFDCPEGASGRARERERLGG